jgi:hypothetical protein
MGGSGLLAISSASYLALIKGSASCSNRSAANPSCFTCKCFLRKSKPYREGDEKGEGKMRRREDEKEGGMGMNIMDGEIRRGKG